MLETAQDEHLAAIRAAVRDSHPLTLAYQALSDREPRRRRARPLALEARGDLTYLRAYCYLAEAELTFRLDRVTAVE